MFIVFEGADKVGKTTQLKMLEQYLVRSRGRENVVVSREVGGTSFGEKVREIMKSGRVDCWEAENILILAARVEHVNRVIRPALAEGKIVLCDRYFASTIAYQGFAEVLLNTEKVFRVLSPKTRLWLDEELYFPEALCKETVAVLDCLFNNGEEAGLERICHKINRSGSGEKFADVQRISQDSFAKYVCRAQANDFVNVPNSLTMELLKSSISTLQYLHYALVGLNPFLTIIMKGRVCDELDCFDIIEAQGKKYQAYVSLGFEYCMDFFSYDFPKESGRFLCLINEGGTSTQSFDSIVRFIEANDCYYRYDKPFLDRKSAERFVSA